MHFTPPPAYNNMKRRVLRSTEKRVTVCHPYSTTWVGVPGVVIITTRCEKTTTSSVHPHRHEVDIWTSFVRLGSYYSLFDLLSTTTLKGGADADRNGPFFISQRRHFNQLSPPQIKVQKAKIKLKSNYCY